MKTDRLQWREMTRARGETDPSPDGETDLNCTLDNSEYPEENSINSVILADGKEIEGARKSRFAGKP